MRQMTCPFAMSLYLGGAFLQYWLKPSPHDLDEGLLHRREFFTCPLGMAISLAASSVVIAVMLRDMSQSGRRLVPTGISSLYASVIAICAKVTLTDTLENMEFGLRCSIVKS